MFRRKRSEFILLAFFLHTTSGSYQRCHDSESINLTNAKKLSNGSYLFEDIVYAEAFVFNSSLSGSVAPHLRGCICFVKNCISICCKNYQAYDEEHGNCSEYSEKLNSTVWMQSVSKEVEISEKFHPLFGKPCKEMYNSDPSYPDDEWNLFENGTLLLPNLPKSLQRTEFCLTPRDPFLYEVNQSSLVPAYCFTSYEPDTPTLIYGYTMLFSVPFLLATSLVYLAIAELRNLPGKSLCCYLISQAVGCTFLALIRVDKTIIVTDIRCQIYGLTAYFGFVASFLWLSVVGFDLWWSFRSMTSKCAKNELKRFILYSVYAWGLASVFLISIVIIQNSNIPEELKPGIGGAEYCWLNGKSWMQMVYLYGLITIIITFNTVMFALTSNKIRQIKKETTNVMGRGDNHNYNRQKGSIALFVRLFVVMGVTWSMEIIAWVTDTPHFYITDICNSSQGLIIFILFVMKKKVKRLIVKRFDAIRGKGTTSAMISGSISSKSISAISTGTKQ